MSDLGTTALLYLGGSFLVYFFPTLVTYFRRVENRGPTFVVNLFLGWTVLGWIIALAMAAGAKRRESNGELEFDDDSDSEDDDSASERGRRPLKACPQCAEEIQLAALVCRFCRYQYPPTTQELTAPPPS